MTVSSLVDIADFTNGLAMQKFRPIDSEDSLPVIKIKELRQGFCDSDSERCSTNISEDFIIHDSDVVFSWSGTLLVDFWCGGTAGLNQHLFKVTSTEFDKWFFFSWVNHHLREFQAIASGKATTMGHIKREDLSKAIVLIPSREEYNKLGSILKPMYDAVIETRLENRKLEMLRDELLPKLMSGKIDVDSIEL